MTTKGSQTIKYNPESMPVKVDSGGTICRFSYDGDNVRRKRLDSNGTIHYVGPYERNVGNGTDTTEEITKFYHALGRLIALRKNGTPYYVHSDHLSGTTRITGGNGNVVEWTAHTAFGETRSGGTSLPTDRQFTGQTLDLSTGLYWYASRPYNPALCRFTQPDTIVPDCKNPQALNRYGYVKNNPLCGSRWAPSDADENAKKEGARDSRPFDMQW